MTNKISTTTDTDRRARILIVEDEEIYGKILDFQLKAKGFETHLCKSGKTFVDYIKTQQMPDLFILDYFLGDDEPSGLELCRKVKSYFDRPVIMLTGNNDVETLVSCLNAGAEQYIVKPCDIRELVARIEVALRKVALESKSEPSALELILDENIRLDWENRCLRHISGETVHLTQKEQGLLELILKEPGRFIDRDSAFNALYGYEMDPLNRSIDILISRLRKKINKLDSGYRIKNYRGHGYALYKADL